MTLILYAYQFFLTTSLVNTYLHNNTYYIVNSFVDNNIKTVQHNNICHWISYQIILILEWYDRFIQVGNSVY